MSDTADPDNLTRCIGVKHELLLISTRVSRTFAATNVARVKGRGPSSHSMVSCCNHALDSALKLPNFETIRLDGRERCLFPARSRKDACRRGTLLRALLSSRRLILFVPGPKTECDTCWAFGREVRHLRSHAALPKSKVLSAVTPRGRPYAS
jgi:hypothetical protein